MKIKHVILYTCDVEDLTNSILLVQYLQRVNLALQTLINRFIIQLKSSFSPLANQGEMPFMSINFPYITQFKRHPNIVRELRNIYLDTSRKGFCVFTVIKAMTVCQWMPKAARDIHEIEHRQYWNSATGI